MTCPNPKRPKIHPPPMAPSARDKASSAMKNPLVMLKIARWLPVKDLFTLRSTCTIWNQAMVPQLKKKHRQIWLDSKIGEFTDQMRQSRDIPFTNVSLARTWPSLEDFSNVCGRLITPLDFYLEADTTLLRQIIFSGQMPELENLGLGASHNQRDTEAKLVCPHRLIAPLPKLKTFQYFGNTNQAWGILAEDVIKCAPSLHSLRLLKGEYCGPRWMLRLSSLSKSHNLRKLEAPKMDAEELQQLVECSRAGNPHLESFSTLVPGCGTRKRLLNEFLEIQTPTLRELKLIMPDYYYYLPPPELFRFTRMDQLRILEVVDPHGLQFQYEFATSLPQLECLQLRYVNSCNGPSRMASDFVQYHAGVKELRVDTNGEEFRALPQLLPSVTRAELHLWGVPTVECRRILETWPNLTRLSLQLQVGRLDMDVLLTGIGPTGVKELRRHLEQSPAMHTTTLESLRAIAAPHKTQIGIRDMTHLREFTLSVVYWHSAVGDVLTDVGVYFGLALASPHLRYINIIGDRVNANLLSEGASVFLRNLLGPLAEINLDSLN